MTTDDVPPLPAPPDEVAPADGDLPALLDERGPERHYVMRVLLLLGAVGCLILGIIGWLIPVLPGFPFYILGAVLAGMASRRVAAFLNRQERRLPLRVRLLLRPKLRHARREEERAARGG
jgi:hypothetical protein